MADIETIHVKVTDEVLSREEPATVVLYDGRRIHPDAPVRITSKSEGVFHVALDQRVRLLINQGTLQKVSATKRVVESIKEAISAPEPAQDRPEASAEAVSPPATKRRGRPPKVQADE